MFYGESDSHRPKRPLAKVIEKQDEDGGSVR